MFEKITPEAAGVSSKHVAKYIQMLNRRGVVMHSVLMMRHGKIFGEFNWAPFTSDFCHRMYSETKSYVAIAIGLLEEEGKLNLDDPIYKYFGDRVPSDAAERLKKQTIREMLTMETAAVQQNWFVNENPDRTNLYFNFKQKPYDAGMLWEYDSPGSQVMSSLVEHLSGMRLLDYLKCKLFDKMGTFRTAQVLKTKNGDSWGDSALVCTTRDMASFGHLVMHYGEWEGERLMNEAYLRKATSPVVCNRSWAFITSAFYNGYGYQIWCVENGGFMFNGMGGQLTLCLPEYDVVYVCTGDNQGFEGAKDIAINGFMDMVIENMENEPLAENAAGAAEVEAIAADLKLIGCPGNVTSPFAAELNGKTYVCDANGPGWTNFRFDFEGDEGVITYTNAQGEKKLRFGMVKNCFGKFPQLGYSNENGGLRTTDGFMYDCAVSAAWVEEKKLMLRVQIIDRYFGNFTAVFSFRDGMAAVQMVKSAEDFLNEYQGLIIAHAQ